MSTQPQSQSQSRSGERGRQQQSSHMLKTGRRGNPFCKDTHDLFATLMVSLDLTDHTRFFRSYPNSFTTDDAAQNLSSLRFSQSNRTTDPNDPQRIVTTTTTTTFSMSRDIAKGICQHFMDARLIENAADPSSSSFRDRGIYQITPKGLHVLERFITKNGISADHLIPVFTSQPICMKLLHLERRLSDDEIHVSRSVIDVVFRRFSGGRHPNYVTDPHDPRTAAATGPRPFVDNARPPEGFDRSTGVELQDVTEKSKSGGPVVIKHVFNSLVGIEWLVDYSTCCCREEGAELLAHCVRYGLITLYLDRSKAGDRVGASEVRGTNTEAEYRHGPRILYRFTDDGRRVAMGNDVASAVPKNVSAGMDLKVSSEGSAEDDRSSTKSSNRDIGAPGDRSFVGGTGLSNAAESQIVGRPSVAELFKSHFSDSGAAAFSKDSHSTTNRLRAILDEPALRALFRDFLRANYCDENLGFWIDVADFRRRFSTTSSAVGGSGASSRKKQQVNASNAMESHQQNLVAAALAIYNTYLAPLSPSELNIDHNLRADVVNFVNRCLAEVAPSGSKQTTSGEEPEIPPLRATQVQTLLRQYERIQEHIFRLLATDQVPRFIRTEAFLALINQEQESRPALTPVETPTVAAAANPPASKSATGTGSSS